MLVEPNEVDQPAQLFCKNCSDNYCEVCFAEQHRKGSRKSHVRTLFDNQISENVKDNGSEFFEGIRDLVKTFPFVLI
jgi:hypothetical protein